MNSHKKIFAGFALFFAILLVLPLQTIHADVADVSNAVATSSTLSQSDVSQAPTSPIEPVTATPAKHDKKHSSTDPTDPTPPVVASSTPSVPNTSASTTIASVAQDATSTATSTPDAPKTGHATITVRDGSVLAWTGTVSFPIGTSTVQVTPTDSTTSVPVLKQSLLATLLRVEKGESDFTISDLEYFPSYGEFFINCVSVPAASSTPDCGNWQYEVDGGYPYSSVDQYQLQDGDQVFLYFGNQQQVDLASSMVEAGESFVATAESYVPATNTFVPLPDQVIGVTQPNPNNPYSPTEIATSTSDQNGNATFIINTPGSYGVGLQADGYFPLTPLTVSSTTGGGGGGPGPGDGNIPAAFAFLTSHQNGDGSFANPIITDWSALALALPDAPSGARSSLVHYLTTTEEPLSVPTDYERHAMALMALGINPYTGSPENVIAPIVAAYNGTSVGDPGIDNPDIFALITLEHAGYSSSDSIIQGIESFVLSKQQPNGSWDNIPDLTAAAIQALTPLSNTSSAIAEAESYLHSVQQSDGGFSNPDSTSWVLNALAARGESPSSWSVGSSTPLTSLASNQQSDGGISPTSENVDSRTWSTAYALTAFEGRSWSSLLGNFSQGAGGGGSSTTTVGDGNDTATTTATTTPVIATTTPLFITPVVTPLLNPATTTVHYYKKKTVPAKNTAFTVSTTSIADAINDRSLGAGVAGAPAAGSFWAGLMGIFSLIGSFFKHLF